MVQPFRVSDGDDPGRNLGGWSDAGDVDLAPGATLSVDEIRGTGPGPAELSTTQFAGIVEFLTAVNHAAAETFDGAVTFNAAVTVDGATFLILDTSKGYRFRTDGAQLDMEATGADLLISNWSGTDFDGSQHSYMRLAAAAQAMQLAGLVEFVDALYGNVRHVLDGAANTIGFHGATPVTQQTVTGSRGGNAALASLLTALDALGLVVDSTTA